MKSIFRNSLRLFVLTAWLCVSNSVAQQLSKIRIVYPKPGQTVGAVDSTFILGRLPSGLPGKPENYIVRVNQGEPFDVYRTGGWIAWVPVTPGEFSFTVEAFPRVAESDAEVTPPPVAVGSVLVNIPEPLPRLSHDSVQIVGDILPPIGDLSLSTGEMLRVSFRGTPGLSAWFQIPGVADSIPMAESEPRPQAFWGESVFGAGAIPDSLLVRGIYSGFYQVPEGVRITDTPLVYHLGLSQEALDVMHLLTGGAVTGEVGDSTYFGLAPLVTGYSSYRVALNDPTFPLTVRFTDSAQTIRHDPRRGYFSIFQPAGVEALAVGSEGDWHKLRLSETQYAWAAQASVMPMDKGTLPPKSYIRVIRTYSEPEFVRVEFPLAGQHPFQVFEDNAQKIRVRLFGVTTDTDWIRYDTRDSLISEIVWSQPEPEVYEAAIHTTEPVWGYDTYYEGNRFYLQLNRPPGKLAFVEGKRIVIDPGHSADPGAVGPTGYTEAEANLGIALMVAELLEHRGAEVIMTRSDQSHVALYDRPTIARIADADLFVSIHNNALPDGVNPFLNHGTSAYYYHLHSLPLARAIHRRMLEATGLPDHGLYHGNLAVNRPTQYPAVLIECAFMILPEQEELVQTKAFRIKVARAISAGIDDFLKERSHGR
ncbi:N-acetylmuramoyl-L-alanine amidase [bacterium]|nr:N-acetylmuramoyl-L-alanine amidase [bacterium]MCB2202015.1 N-acetylmuramoyl-L-alanine amidase [bacterium]